MRDRLSPIAQLPSSQADCCLFRTASNVEYMKTTESNSQETKMASSQERIPRISTAIKAEVPVRIAEFRSPASTYEVLTGEHNSVCHRLPSTIARWLREYFVLTGLYGAPLLQPFAFWRTPMTNHFLCLEMDCRSGDQCLSLGRSAEAPSATRQLFVASFLHLAEAVSAPPGGNRVGKA